MREIKFRAYFPDGNIEQVTALKWVDGVISDVFFADGYRKNAEDVTLMQDTGLKDKNGKDIYESDIIKDYGHIEKKNRVVMWNYSGFYLDYSGTPLSTAQDVEVIGNIYQNPDLL